MKRYLGACCLGVILIGGVQAAAAVIYEQPLATEPEGFYSNLGGQTAADQFELAANATITRVTWYGLYAPGAGVQDPVAISPIDFSIRFFSDSAGLPGTVLSDQAVSALVQDSGSTVTAAGAFLGHAIYQFQADLPADVSVGPGSVTWLSIVDTDPDTLGLWWLWSDSPSVAGDTKAWGSGDPELWTLSRSNGQLAFTLEGVTAIPVPGAILLAALGAGLVTRLRRRRAL